MPSAFKEKNNVFLKKTPGCFSVVVSVDDDESNTRTTQNDSDPSTAVSGLCETSPRGSLAHLIHEDDLGHIPNKQSRRRSLIWRLFEHLDNLNAARCRICMKKLHKSGGISNLRRHLVKRHPKVLSELLSTNHRPAVPSQDVNVAGVSRESYLGTEPHPGTFGQWNQFSSCVVLSVRGQHGLLSSSELL